MACSSFQTARILPASRLLVTLLFAVTFLSSCKKDNESNGTPDPVAADSSSISSLIVSCKSSDATAMGFAVIDIQQFFLTRKLISSTFKGKLFSVKAVNEADFKAVIDQVVVDLQTPESYFSNYDSFLALLEERIKAKTGFQKTYEISEAQIDQLFNKQDISLAFQEKHVRPVLLCFASAGLGALRLGPLAETFTLNRFQGLVSVGANITGLINSNQSLKKIFIAGASRSTSQTRDNQVLYKSYTGGTSGLSYSYAYPLPPSPAPVFDAPAWYWHQYRDKPTGGASIGSLPSGASTTSWGTTQARYDVLRVRSQQITGGTVSAAPPQFGTLDPKAVVTDAETAYILYSANFIQNYRDAGVVVWSALDNSKREFYQIGLHTNGDIRIDKFIKVDATGNGGTPTWAVTWKK